MPSIVGLATDPAGEIYAVDGLHVHIYTASGSYEKSITPGLNLGQGLVVADPQHIFVAGRAPRGGIVSHSATIFELGSGGTSRSFSDVFHKDRTGMDDMVLNKESYLSLDRKRKLIYQVPQSLYEVRVFGFNGNLVSTIVPPQEYRIRIPEVRRPMGPDSAVTQASDYLFDIVSLPEGGFAVLGDIQVSVEQHGSVSVPKLDRFVDVYNAKNEFVRRLRGSSLMLNGAYFIGFDQTTGEAFFKTDDAVLEARLQ